jgi:hypothetical protein
MARTTVWKPKRIRSEDERRGGGSQFINVDEGENFIGYALFEADPSKDDPGYYEFAQHWVGGFGAKGGSVPCADENCPLCEDGDRPKTRAYSLWLVTQDGDKSKIDPPQLRIFEMNYNVIKIFTEYRAEDEKIKGRLFRVGKLDDRGNWNVTPKTDTMTATNVKASLKDPNAPDFEAMITSKLRKAMEGLAVARAVEDDEDEEPTPKARKAAGKPAAEKPAAKTRAKAWPDELDEEDVTVSEVDDDANYFVAAANGFKGTKQVFTTDEIEFDLSDLSEDDVVTITAALDDDGDYILSAEPVVGEAEPDEDEEEPEDEEPDEDEDEEESDLPESIEDVEFIVKKVNAGESTLDVENDDLAFELFFLDQGPASEVDFDDYEEGVTIIVSAEKDSQGDMVATEVPKVKKTTARKTGTSGRKTTTTRKGK